MIIQKSLGVLRCLNVDPWNALRLTSRRCFTLTVFAAAIPAWWEISTMTEPCFNHLRITLPPSNLTCHLMASKRQSIVVWCGGTEIPAASNFSIKATLAQRTTRSEGATAHSPKLADFTLLPISRCPQGFQAGAPALSSYVKYSSAH